MELFARVRKQFTQCGELEIRIETDAVSWKELIARGCELPSSTVPRSRKLGGDHTITCVIT